MHAVIPFRMLSDLFHYLRFRFSMRNEITVQPDGPTFHDFCHVYFLLAQDSITFAVQLGGVSGTFRGQGGTPGTDGKFTA